MKEGGMSVPSELRARAITVGYGRRTILENLDVDIPRGELTVIVGPNACGKSTLLRALARMLPVTSGEVELDGRSIRSLPPKEVARRLGLLPQTPVAPDGIVAQGPVNDIVTSELLADVYGLPCALITDPVSGRPLVVPLDDAEGAIQ